MKLNILFAYISVGICGVYSNYCSSDFNTQPACVTEYGIALPDVWRRSTIDCARTCKNTTCQSFLFFQETRICRRNTGLLTNFSLPCAEPHVYGEKNGETICSDTQTTTTTPAPTTTVPVPTTTTTPAPTTTTPAPTTTTPVPTTTTTAPTTAASNAPDPGLYFSYPYIFMNMACIVAIDCEVLYGILNNQCVGGICMCQVGYKFDWTLYNCVLDCANFGHSYQIQYDGFINAYDDAILTSVSEFTCLQACTDETGFLCLSVDFEPSTGTCHLSKETAITMPSSYWNSQTFNLYHRDCLFE